MNTFYPIYQISIKWCLRQFSRTLLQYYLVNFFYMLLYNLLLFVHSNNTFKKSIVPVTFWCNAFTSTDDLNQNTKCHWIQRERNELRGTSRVWAGGTVYHFFFWFANFILDQIQTEKRCTLQSWNGCGQNNTRTAGLIKMSYRWQKSCNSNLTKFGRKIVWSDLSIHCECIPADVGKTTSALSYLISNLLLQ